MRFAKTVLQWTIPGLLLVMTACGGSGGGGGNSGNNPPPAGTGDATVLAANDLGMHCMDKEFSVFSILPPFNVINAQVVFRDADGRPYLADETGVDVFYDAVADASGSISSYSFGKTDFWSYADQLFNTSLQPGQGLTGLYMPDDDPQNRSAQPMEFSLAKDMFTAEGIPITPIDDALDTNPYSMLQVQARDPASGQTLGHLNIVVPVATETDCQTCHKKGGIAASSDAITWSDNGDLEIQSKLNILKLHDANHPANLEGNQPVLCAQCHYSPALDLAGNGPDAEQRTHQTFSNVMHAYHGSLRDGSNQPVFNATLSGNCYQCHPGNITQCLRGAMANGGINCFDCHGDLSSVGGVSPLLSGGSIDGTNDGQARRPWQDLPRCQACHTGDAVSYLTGTGLEYDPDWPFRLRQAYRTGDDSASPLLAINQRFAENADTLFRYSKGHGNIACEGCHGSTHAIWPNADPSANDNATATALQGHTGPIIECTVCHAPGSLSRTTSGPHGLHNINDRRWYDEGHGNYYRSNKSSCKACHGQDLLGTPLAKVTVARSFQTEERNKTYAKGDFVKCSDCHGLPSL
jgi:hypothetical protein